MLRRRVLAWLLIAVSLFFDRCLSHEPVVIYVSPAGSDSDSGTANSPLRTLRAAQLKARRYPATTILTIQLASGVYRMNETMVLTSEDSGTAESPRTFSAAPGAQVTITGSQPVSGWRAVRQSDAGYRFLDHEARARVLVAPFPSDKVPSTLFDEGASEASPADRAIRALPNINAVSSLVPVARSDSDTCRYIGQFKSELACRSAALAQEGLWAYAWHDPAIILGDFAGGCYGRHDFHGSRNFPAEEGVMSAVFPPSTSWREMSDWDITSLVTTQHRCDGAECEDFDSAASKSVMNTSLPDLENLVGNAASDLYLRIYLVDFAMNVLPVASITGGLVNTAIPGTLRLGQRPGYCDQDFNENRCSPAVWLLNTMKGLSMPGQYAFNFREGTMYYWPALASNNVSSVSVTTVSTLISLRSSSSKPVEHVAFRGVAFTGANYERQYNWAPGGIQHDWAPVRSNSSLLTLSGVSDVIISACSFRDSPGSGVRAEGFAKNVTISNNTFYNIGHEAIGIYGFGLGLTQATTSNTIAFNDVASTGMMKFDSPSIVLWEASRTVVMANYIHDTSSRALYIGGSRYCTRPDGFATDGGITTNRYEDIRDENIPSSWLNLCGNISYAPDFTDDCKCSFFRGAHGSKVLGNVFARVTQRKASTMFSDGLVYVSGPGYEESVEDVTVFEDNTYLASPGEGVQSFRMLYVDGYTGAMIISRNAVVDGNSYQGFNLCNWYGHSVAQANVIQLGDQSWGGDYQISCDGNVDMGEVVNLKANLVLSDETSPSHDPDAGFLTEYSKVYDTVCNAGGLSAAPTDVFLAKLNTIIEKLGGKSRRCAHNTRHP